MTFQWLQNRRSAFAKAKADARLFEAAYNETVKQLVATQEEVKQLKLRLHHYREHHFAERQRFDAQKEALSEMIVKLTALREPAAPEWSDPTNYQGA